VRGTFIPITFDSLGLDLERAIAWIQGHDIPIEPTRLHKYRKLIKEVIDVAERGDALRADSHFRAYANALYEAHDLVQIWQGLQSLRFDSFRERLRHVVSGPEHYSDEKPSNSSNRARNAAFELLVISQFARSGFTVNEELPTDAAFQTRQASVLVECKRLQSEFKLKDNVSDAKRQLRRKFADARRSRYYGMIAVDITKASNPEFRLLNAPSATTARSLVEQHISEFVDKHSPVLDIGGASRVLAFLLRIAVYAHCEDSNTLMYCQQWGLASVPELGQKAGLTLNEIQECLGAGEPGWQS
jgi:hypothetical protein